MLINNYIINVMLLIKRNLIRLLQRFPSFNECLRNWLSIARVYIAVHYRHKLLREVLSSNGRVLASIRDLKKIPKKNIKLNMQIGQKYLDAGDFASAMKHFTDLLKSVNYSKNNVLMVGHALAVAGYLEQSAQVYAEAARRHPIKRSRVCGQEVQVLPYYWVDRVGHLAFLDAFIKMMIMGWIPPRLVILLAPKERIANLTYLDYWGHYLVVESDPNRIAELTPMVNLIEDHYFGAYFAPSGAYCWWIKAAKAAVVQWDREQRSPLLHLTNSDERYAKLALEELGIGADDWFVCLHVRESGYHSQKNDPSQTWRDSDIERFDDAIDAIIQRGGWVIRMGDPSMKPMRPRERFVDYALSSLKNERTDVILCARSRFFIATNSGLGILPATFGVPAIAVDYIPLANELFIKNGCFIPKLCWSRSNNRYLNFEECMQQPLGNTHNGISFADIELRANSSEEIRELVLEMMDRLDEVLQTDETADYLQARFDEIRVRNGVVYTAPIGREFIKRHADLLGPELGSVPKMCKRNTLVESFGLPLNTAANNYERAKVLLAMDSFGMARVCLKEAWKLQPDDSLTTHLLNETNMKLARWSLNNSGLSTQNRSEEIAQSMTSSVNEVNADLERWRDEMPTIVKKY